MDRIFARIQWSTGGPLCAHIAKKRLTYRKKRKLAKERAKLEERRRLEMVHEGDAPTLGDDHELFSLTAIRRAIERREVRERAAALAEARRRERKQQQPLGAETKAKKSTKQEEGGNEESLAAGSDPSDHDNDEDFSDRESKRSPKDDE